nr:uncharacterized protein LOC109158416 [Ipomoea batatas]
MRYINGKVLKVKIDPDMICYHHLLKYIKNEYYEKIDSLSFKLSHEPLEMLKVLCNDETSLQLVELGKEWGKCEIYVEHGVEDVELCPPILCLPPPPSVPPKNPPSSTNESAPTHTTEYDLENGQLDDMSFDDELVDVQCCGEGDYQIGYKAKDKGRNMICYHHLLKYIKNEYYEKIDSLSFKLSHEPLEMLKVLCNDETSLQLVELGKEWGKCEIYVEHGVEDVELCPPILCLPPPPSVPPKNPPSSTNESAPTHTSEYDLENGQLDDMSFDDELVDVQCCGEGDYQIGYKAKDKGRRRRLVDAGEDNFKR